MTPIREAAKETSKPRPPGGKPIRWIERKIRRNVAQLAVSPRRPRLLLDSLSKAFSRHDHIDIAALHRPPYAAFVG